MAGEEGGGGAGGAGGAAARLQREQLRVLVLDLAERRLRARQLLAGVPQLLPRHAHLTLHVLDRLLVLRLLALALLLLVLLPLEVGTLVRVHRVELGEQRLDGLLIHVYLRAGAAPPDQRPDPRLWPHTTAAGGANGGVRPRGGGREQGRARKRGRRLALRANSSSVCWWSDSSRLRL